MLIPSKMTNLMERYFYDKNIEVYTYKLESSPEGGRPKRGDKVTKGTIKCNVHHVSDEDMRKEYGISTESRLMITCSRSNDGAISKGDLINYHNVEYEVIEILSHDSHLKVVCS